MANDAQEMKLEPPHPGELIREDILPALGLTITQLASHLGVSRVALSEVLNEKRSVSLGIGAASGPGVREQRTFLAYDANAVRHLARGAEVGARTG